jgi:hypothetical protein
MNPPPLELCPDGSDAFLGLVEGLRRSDSSELAVRTVLEPREGEDRVQLLAMPLKCFVPTDESRRDQKRTDEVDQMVRTAMLLLTIEEDPIEAPPLGGLTGLVDQPPVVQNAGDVGSRAALAEQARQRLDLTFRE